MTVTARTILALPDRRVDSGLSATVRALVSERDPSMDIDRDEHLYNLQSPLAVALEARLATHVKQEEIVDDGDGRYAIDVVCLDGRPVAVVSVDGYDSFNYRPALLDRAALDEIVQAVRGLRRDMIQDIEVTDLDQDIGEALGLSSGSGPAGP